MRSKAHILFLLSAFAAAPAAAFALPSQYSAMQVDLLAPDAFFRAVTLSDSALVAGEYTFTLEGEPTIWPGNVPTSVAPGVVGTFNRLSGSGLFGAGNTTTPDFNPRAFRWTPGGGLQHLTDDMTPSEAFGVNDSGLTGGRIFDDAVIWDAAGNPTTLRFTGGLPGFGASANGVSNTGFVAGAARTSLDERHAFIWTSSTGVVDIGTLGGPESWALDVNDLGHAVGSSSTAGFDNRAFIYQSGVMTEIPGPVGQSSEAVGINNAGVVIGIDRGFIGLGTAWVYDGGVPVALTTLLEPGVLPLGYSIDAAFDINESGQIVARATDPSTFESRYYVLTPVPAPGAAVLMFSSFAALGARRRPRG